MGPGLREFLGQVETEVISNNRNKIYPTWGPLLSPVLYVHHSVNLAASLHFVSPLASVPSSVPIGMRCCCRAHMGLILSCSIPASSSIRRLDLPLPIKEEKCLSLLLPSPSCPPPPPLWLRQTCLPLSLSPPVNCSLIEAAVSPHPFLAQGERCAAATNLLRGRRGVPALPRCGPPPNPLAS